jgi:hypothetical protein
MMRAEGCEEVIIIMFWPICMEIDVFCKWLYGISLNVQQSRGQQEHGWLVYQGVSLCYVGCMLSSWPWPRDRPGLPSLPHKGSTTAQNSLNQTGWAMVPSMGCCCPRLLRRPAVGHGSQGSHRQHHISQTSSTLCPFICPLMAGTFCVMLMDSVLHFASLAVLGAVGKWQ